MIRYFIPFIVLALALASCKDTKSERIRAAVKSQLSLYPESALQDIYKNFFQDYFGPGHIVGDTASAGAYLDRELASFEQAAGPYYEPAGYNGNFFRVNLSLIKEGIISRDAFFDAFLRSVSNIQIITLEEWEREWQEIDSVIHTMNLTLAGYEQERAKIFSLLEQGNYVAHHSEPFSKAYDPHYRIIGREIFQKEIRPLLPR
ncbi:MAG: hypothetical protein LBU37_00720 [Tannerellaceae bacterium]|jgi:hypothetical protein|nr:hypothetical protein [Tannerellaceae bacterium]